MNPLPDYDLQAYLDHDPAVDRAGVERRLAAEPETRAALAAYKGVWAALGQEPAAPPPGFAGRVMARVAAEATAARTAATARPETPWLEYALLALVVATGLVTALVFRDVLAASWLGAAAPWVLLGGAALALAEAADRLLLRRTPTGLAG